ncbi:MAG: CHASE2 domain-containing protein [Richelia sp. RM1_1_1]|nr:CHASE2 domain-containing protein [Richelia sp. SM1_7_0]NJN11173.1 CHASE2 domain-containing protein [Richelia sp. RM1_1_1]
MNKLVVLNLGQGNLYRGFPDVTAQVGLASHPRAMKLQGSLPPAPEIPPLYQNWQALYSALYQHYGYGSFRLGVVEDVGITNISEAEFETLSQQLSSKINTWLNSEQFRKVEQTLRTELNPNEEISFIISSRDTLLRRLPWHLWDFFESYPNAEVGLASLELQKPSRISNKDKKVKILAIFGNSEGIDISQDRYFLEKLSSKAKITCLIEPQREKLSNELWTKGWDILFFAGHSYSQEIGVLQINQNVTITLDKLKYALQKAIENGLQLAIFNSCDGLGLAEALEDLHIPHVIVMREPVPDLVAQDFFKYFLTEFSRGQSLYSSLHQARKRLQAIEDKFPCASWLPIICHNPLEPPMIWKQYRKIITYKNVLIVLLASFLVTGLIMGVRYFGYLQPSELHAFDHFMQLRSQFVTERPDRHLLIVTIDENDIQYQQKKYGDVKDSLSDQALADLLKKLDQNKAQTIGLDLHRTHEVENKNINLTNPYQDDNRLVVICKAPTDGKDGYTEGIRPPSGVPSKRIGFSDFVADDDEVARRHLLNLTISSTSKSQCLAKEAFSLRIALNYLAEKGKTPSFGKEDNFQIDNIVFKRLKQRSSGYQKVDINGYQILLNYRSLTSVDKIAEKVRLEDILDEKVPLERLKERIVLIGRISLTDLSIKDLWKTPFSSSTQPNNQVVPGVFVQAQMVSQIISSVLDSRPLLWWWSSWVEVLWVWAWSLLGSIVVFYFSKPLHLGIGVAIALFALFSICFSIFVRESGWIPFIPPALAFLATQAAIVLWFKRLSI